MKSRLVFFILASVFTAQISFASISCPSLFVIAAPQSRAVKKIVIEDAYQQWLRWEQWANWKVLRKPSTPIEIPLVLVEPKEVDIRTTKETPPGLTDLFRTPEGNILWPQHPFNTSRKVPYQRRVSARALIAYMTASRSLALKDSRGFTIKLPTNFPHARNRLKEYEKINTKDDVASALIHSEHLLAVDQAFGRDEKLIVLKEVMTLSERETGIGMIIRDARQLDDGHYYLPALSIPYVGREIARVNGAPFGRFFEQHYAALLGEAKARLLLRTGLQMETPNPQNILIQLDRNLRPTGKIVFRDISDAFLVDVVAKGLGYRKQMRLDRAADFAPVKEVHPYWPNSFMRFWQAGKLSVSTRLENSWGRAHNRAYIEYLERELGMKFDQEIDGFDANYIGFNKVYASLKSDIGQRKLRQYRDRKVAAAGHQPRLKTGSEDPISP